MIIKKNNIILITIDCLRPDHLSCYGSKLVKTPNIDSLAKDGILFLNAYTNGSNTSTSVSSFLTSIATPFIKPNHLKIQELLKCNGYYTFGLNPNVQLLYQRCKQLNLTNGFDIYKTFLNWNKRYKNFLNSFLIYYMFKFSKWFETKHPIHKLIWQIFKFLPFKTDKTAPRASFINKEAISILKKKHTPFFMWLFYLDIHEPYLPEKSMQTNYLTRKFRYFKADITKQEARKLHELYIGEIINLDFELGKLFRILKEMNIYKSTTIILIADHGEEFREHNGLGHNNIYDEILSIPLIIKESNKIQERKINTMVSLIDLAPTIADFAGIESKNSFSGESLKNIYISQKEFNKSIFSFSDFFTINFSFRTERWKLIFRKDREELYDVKKDPKEKSNLIEVLPDVAKELKKNAYIYLKRQKYFTKMNNEKLLINKAILKLH